MYRRGEMGGIRREYIGRRIKCFPIPQNTSLLDIIFKSLAFV